MGLFAVEGEELIKGDRELGKSRGNNQALFLKHLSLVPGCVGYLLKPGNSDVVRIQKPGARIR
jgi:hypothetical protein